MGNLIGPDVSHHQGAIDWSQVGTTAKFGFCKATEGVTFVDSRMEANRRGMEDTGLVLRGLYHFARPGRNSAVDEGNHYVDVVGRLDQGEVAVLDLETTDLDRTATGVWARKWLELVGSRLNTLPWLYSFGPFLAAMDTGDMQEHPLWIARYGTNDGEIPLQRPNTDRWPRFTLWQFTSNGRQAGVNGRCDLSLFEGSDDELRRLAGDGMSGPQGQPQLPHSFVTRGFRVNVRAAPNTSSRVIRTLPGPTPVDVTCQVRGQQVTVGNRTSDLWASIPALGGFVANVLVDSPDPLLPGVPMCP